MFTSINRLPAPSIVCARQLLAVLTLAFLGALPLRAEIIYRETFGRTNGATGNLNPSLFGWQHFLSSGNAETGNNAISADGTGKPIDVANVNAGPNLDGTFEAQPEGWHYLDGTRRLTFTPEKAFDTTEYVPGSIVFSWHQGNAYTTAGFHLIVRIAGVWYVSVVGITNSSAVTAGANFGLDTGGAVPVSMVFNPAAANWNLLNFDGDFDHLTITRQNSTLGAPTAGSAAPADLGGQITAFGLWRAHDNTGFGNSRFDSFTVEGTPAVVVPPKNVQWQGGASGDWDTVAVNWLTNVGPATTYRQGDFVRFDDSATGETNINLIGLLVPGSVTVSNQSLAYVFGGSGTLGGVTGLKKQGAGLLILTNGGGSTMSGAVLIEQGTLQVGAGETGGGLGSGVVTNAGALVINRANNLSLNNAIHGSGSLTKEGAGALTLGVNGTLAGGSALTLAAGTTLTGFGTNSGAVSVGGELAPGTSPGTLTVGDLTLQSGSTATFELNTNNTVGGGVNDLIAVNGNLTLNNNQLTIDLLNLPQTGVPYRLINYLGARSGSFNPSVTISEPTRLTATLDYSTANQVNLTLSGTSASLKWAGADPSYPSVWDSGVTTNWVTVAGNLPDAFFLGDNVAFDNSATQPFVMIQDQIGNAVAVVPSAMTVHADLHAFAIVGPGKISGGTSLVKSGDNSLTLSAANDFTGPVTINAGTLIVGNNAALGTATGGTLVATGATLDFSGRNIGLEPVTVSGAGVGGAGALFNGGAQIFPAVARVTLTGDTTFGGTGRWDLRSATTSNTNQSSLLTGGQPYRIIKVGPNQVSIVGTYVDPALGNIEVQEGTFSLEVATSSAGNVLSNLNVHPGATLQFFNLAVALNKRIAFTNANFNNDSGANVIIGPVWLEGSCTFDIDGGTTLTISNVVSGTGSLTKVETGTLNLSGVNTYVGDTTINVGTLGLVGAGSLASANIVLGAAPAILDVRTRVDGMLTLSSGQSLIGDGTVQGRLLSSAGSTVSPGLGTIGTLTVTNTATLQGGTVMELDKAGVTQDLLQSFASITYGGTLYVTNLSEGFAPLAVGDSFKIFHATSYAGTFVAIVPPAPGPGLKWGTNSLAVDGTLHIVSGAPQINSVAITGGQFVFSGGSSFGNATYHVLTATNVAEWLTNWARVKTNVFDVNGNFSFTNGTPADPQRYYRLEVVP